MCFHAQAEFFTCGPGVKSPANVPDLCHQWCLTTLVVIMFSVLLFKSPHLLKMLNINVNIMYIKVQGGRY